MTLGSIRQITSLSNATVKMVRSLHLRKEREASGLFLAEGLKIATEALQLGFSPQVLMFGPDAAAHPLLQKIAEHTSKAGGDVAQVTPDILEKVSRRDNPQMVVAVFGQAYRPVAELQLGAATCWVALQAVRDPGNLGTIVRTADAAGCGGVILVGDCCDAFSVEAVRATMGSIFATPIYRATTSEFMVWRAAWPGAVIGTLLSATEDFRAAPYRAPNLILMGNEQKGLSPELADLCDVNVKIPMRGRADSLNLAVATGVMIYAVT
jgi:TrmH family RNA methyltransferase